MPARVVSRTVFLPARRFEFFDLAEPIPGPSTKVLGEVAREARVAIVAGLFERRAPGLYHNTAVTLGTDGAIASVYRKMHIPDDPLYYEKYYFTPGDLGFQAVVRVYEGLLIVPGSRALRPTGNAMRTHLGYRESLSMGWMFTDLPHIGSLRRGPHYCATVSHLLGYLLSKRILCLGLLDAGGFLRPGF